MILMVCLGGRRPRCVIFSRGSYSSRLTYGQIWWIIPPFLLYTASFGGALVPKVNLIQNLICHRYYMKMSQDDPSFSYTPIMFGQDDQRCTDEEIESRATNFMTGGSIIAGLLSAISSPKLGELSDYYGRKSILSFVVCGSLVSEILTIFAAKYPYTFPIYWLYLGFACEGASGSFIAGMAISNAYAADCTPPLKRNVAFGYFHGCLFTGIALGPLAAAQILKVAPIVTIFYIALAFHLFFIVFLITFVPESLSHQRQMTAREKRKTHKEGGQAIGDLDACNRVIYAIASVFRPLKILLPRGPGTSNALRRNLVALAAIDFIVFGVAMGSMTVITIYARKQFDWDIPRQSEYVSVVNISRVLVLFLVLPTLSKLIRGKQRSSKPQSKGCDALDVVLIRSSIVFDTLGYVGYTLSRVGSLFTLSGVVASFGGMASPTLQSAITKHVPHDRTGQLLGATGLLHAIARLTAPIVFNTIFAKTNHKFRQTVFVCLTTAFVLALTISAFLKKGVYLEEVDAVDVLSHDYNDSNDSRDPSSSSYDRTANNNSFTPYNSQEVSSSELAKSPSTQPQKAPEISQ